MTSSATAFAILLVGCLGAGLGFWLARSRAAALIRVEHAEWQVERSRLESAAARLEGEFQAQGRSLRQAQNELTEQRRLNRDLDAVIAPVRSGLDTLVNRVGSAERARVEAQTEITQQLGHMAQQFGQATLDVRNEARRLSRVLSRSERRGAWGEMQLRTLVESSGMLKHVHFEEQDHSRGEGGVLRPDLVVHLSEGRHAVVDAKVPLDAFLQMGDEDDDSHTLARHADSVAAHIGKLAAKEYWRRYNSPEFVIMFLPAEGLLVGRLVCATGTAAIVDGQEGLPRHSQHFDGNAACGVAWLATGRGRRSGS